MSKPSSNSSSSSDPSLTLIGAEKYPGLTNDEFLNHFSSIPWITYRTAFPPIPPTQHTTDLGWGCMLRSGQMLLATTLIRHHLSPDFRIPKDTTTTTIDEDNQALYAKIISWFFDSNSSVFSIHRIALLGASSDYQQQLGKRVGEWFGPSTISQVLSSVVAGYEDCGLSIHVAMDNVIYKSSIFNNNHMATSLDDNDQDATGKVCSSMFPVLILIPLLLGTGNQMNPSYTQTLKSCFDVSACVGIAGGRPNSSFYFVGYQNDDLIYLDPHFVRPCLKAKDASTYTYQDLISYQCPASPDTAPGSGGAKLTSIASLDPSCVVGFYCACEGDWDNLCEELERRLIIGGERPLFCIEDGPPPKFEGSSGQAETSDDEDDW